MNARITDRYYPDIDNRENWTTDTLYEALTAVIRRDRANYGGMAIASERQLASGLGVDRSLVHRVYERLKKAELLYRPDDGRRYFLSTLRDSRDMAYPVIGIILPVCFSEYITLTEARQRRQSIYNGIVDRAAELGFGTIPLQLPAPDASGEEIRKYLAAVLPRVSGIIHLGDRSMDFDRPLLKVWEHREVPQVCVSCWTDLDYIGSVSYDAESAVNSMSCYLKEFGHKKAGVIMPLRKRDHSLCHYDLDDPEELKVLFKTAGMDIQPQWIFSRRLGPLNGDFRKQLELQLKKWFGELAGSGDCPTAFWCRGDLAALILIRVIHQAGYRVPEDFSVIGMDDVREAEASTPALTTLRQPNYDSGVHAVNMLYDISRHGTENRVLKKKLPMALIARNSVGACRSAKELPLIYGVY